MYAASRGPDSTWPTLINIVRVRVSVDLLTITTGDGALIWPTGSRWGSSKSRVRVRVRVTYSLTHSLTYSE